MEDITGGFLVGIFRAIFSLLRWLLIDALTDICFYWLGRISLLILTLGHYPRGAIARDHEGRISCFGLFVAVIIFSAIITG